METPSGAVASRVAGVIGCSVNLGPQRSTPLLKSEIAAAVRFARRLHVTTAGLTGRRPPDAVRRYCWALEQSEGFAPGRRHPHRAREMPAPIPGVRRVSSDLVERAQLG